MGYNHHRTPSPDRAMPTPPEGYITRENGGVVAELKSIRTARLPGGSRGPIDGVLVWAEGDWRPVVDIGPRFRRSVEVSYTGSKLSGSTVIGQWQQRVEPERIAIRPELIPHWMHMEEQEARREAERAQRDQQRREIREETKAEEAARAAAERAAKLAAMTPEQRRAQIEHEVVLAELLVESREEQVTDAQARLDEARARLDALRAELA